MEAMLQERGLCIKELLTIAPFHKAIVHSGEIGFDNIVSRVNVMEVPDVVNWVQKGEFLMTTGYPFRDDPDRFLELIPQLVARGVSGLGIKTRRFLEKIPDQAIELAIECKLPLVELPPETVFSELMRTVMEKVFYKESRHLSVLQDRLEAVTKLLLEHQGLEVILKELERIIGNPLLLINEHNSIIFLSDSLLESRHVLNQLQWQQLREKLFTQQEYFFPLAFEEEQSVRSYVTAIPGKKINQPLLVVLETLTHNTPIDVMTVERVSALIGLELVNLEARQMIEAKYFDQFIYDWLQGFLQIESDIRLRAEASGCSLLQKANYLVVLMRWQSAQPDDAFKRKLVDELRYLFMQDERLRQGASSLSLERILISVVNGEVVMVVERQEKRERRSLISTIEEKLNSLMGTKKDDYSISLCLGYEVDSVSQVYTSYEQAKKVAHISQVCALNLPAISYEDLGVYRLIYLLPRSEEVDRYVLDLLQPLIAYDNHHNKNLLPTLVCYFETNRSIKDTAQILYTHYNTIVYRMERIKQLLAVDFENPDIQLQLQLAIKIYLIYKQKYNSHQDNTESR